MEKRGMLTVLLYSNGDPADRLQRTIREGAPSGNLEVFKTLGSFSERLRKPMDDAQVAVIFATSEEDLLAMLTISDLLHNVRLILILPDRKDSTVAIGHSLRPRFLSYVDGNFSEITAVLGKMISGFSHSRDTRGLLPDAGYPGAIAEEHLQYKKLAR
jgi:hypothetical protein